MSLKPIYTATNCNVAFQLDWSLSIFWRERIGDERWFDALKEETERDGVRLLQHRFARDGHSLFLVSTKPHVAPSEIARSVKGRLQHLVRKARPKAFQRNYSLRAVGSTKREKLDAYIASQLHHHPMRLVAQTPGSAGAGPAGVVWGARWLQVQKPGSGMAIES
jgi:hypothetical protein